MTLLYGLTAAPASQPRNVLAGQAVSLFIALAISYLHGMDLSVRESLGTALAVAAMVKLGLTHPPAGAASLLFVGQDLKMSNLAATLLGNVVAVAAATFINNLSYKRQYPTTWGVRFVMDRFKQTKDESTKD